MKSIKIILICSLFLMFCEQYPLNPEPAVTELFNLNIKHTNTFYIETSTPIEGLLAERVNVLEFQLTVENFNPMYIEFFGQAVLGGPPDSKQHAFFFRTDTSHHPLCQTEYHVQALMNIIPDSVYTFYRMIIPTNEYAPFANSQGMVENIRITNTYAVDNRGVRKAVPITEK